MRVLADRLYDLIPDLRAHRPEITGFVTVSPSPLALRALDGLGVEHLVAYFKPHVSIDSTTVVKRVWNTLLTEADYPTALVSGALTFAWWSETGYIWTSGADVTSGRTDVVEHRSYTRIEVVQCAKLLTSDDVEPFADTDLARESMPLLRRLWSTRVDGLPVLQVALVNIADEIIRVAEALPPEPPPKPLFGV